jgi:peptidoglycan/xylan/chitin deacetylase (PgdA/CDA1 family)
MEGEIIVSRDEMQERLGRKVDVFCYPDGKYSEEVKEALRRNGYIAACATGRDLNHGDVDVFGLKRIPFEREPMPRFAVRIAGWT